MLIVAARSTARSYCELTTRCFAEFLNEDSLVHLPVLREPTWVGFRYGPLTFNSRGFSWKFLRLN